MLPDEHEPCWEMLIISTDYNDVPNSNSSGVASYGARAPLLDFQQFIFYRAA